MATPRDPVRVAPHQRLHVNIDHVATLRQARGGDEPSPVHAARGCEDAGADGITVHLREDRRHIQDHDVRALRETLRTPMNLEMACTHEMLGIALRTLPHAVTLVPERRAEVTTEGGLDLGHDRGWLAESLDRLRAAGIRTAVFIDPDPAQIEAARALGADAVELHTGRYAEAFGSDDPTALAALDEGSRLAASLGLAVHAGHGLTIDNVAGVAAIPEVEELNIGHHLVSLALFIGLPAAVSRMRRTMDAARVRFR